MDYLQKAYDAFGAADDQGLKEAAVAALIAIAEGQRAILGAIVPIEPDRPDVEGWRGES